MHIEIPPDAVTLAEGQAQAGGFASVNEYITSLIRRHAPAAKLTRDEALEKLRQLRAETPKLSRQEIVGMAAEARAELP